MEDPAITQSRYTRDDLLEHSEFVESIARHATTDEHAAADVRQGTWLKALRRPPRREGSVKSWFRRVVTTVAHDEHASRTRNALYADWERDGDHDRDHGGESVVHTKPDPTTPDPFAVLAEREDVARLFRAMRKLRPADREVIELHYYEDLAPREIAERLETPIDTVYTRLRRGLRHLREVLEREDRSLPSWLLLWRSWGAAPFTGALAAVLVLATSLWLASDWFTTREILPLETRSNAGFADVSPAGTKELATDPRIRVPDQQTPVGPSTASWLSQTATLRIEVVDARSGAALEGFALRLEPVALEPGALEENAVLSGDLGPAGPEPTSSKHVVRTDAAGISRAAGLAAGLWRLRPESGEPRLLRAHVGDETRLRLEVEAQRALSVSVMGLDRRPAAEAELWASWPRSPDEMRPVGRTDQAGHALLEGLDNAAWLQARSADGRYFSRSIFLDVPGADDGKISLFIHDAPTHLQGRVIDQDGQPIAGAKVRALRAPGYAPILTRYSRLELRALPQDAISASDGRFEMSGDLSGTFELHGSATGFWPGRAQELPGDDACGGELEIRLQRQQLGTESNATPVSGVLVDVSGEPLVGWSVALVARRGGARATFSYVSAQADPSTQSVTDERGAFCFERGQEVGRALLLRASPAEDSQAAQYSQPQYSQHRAPWFTLPVVTAEDGRYEVDSRVAPRASIRGQVPTPAERQELELDVESRERLLLVCRQASWSRALMVDAASGAFEAEHLPAGRYELFLWTRTSLPHRLMSFALAPSAALELGTMPVPEFGGLRVRAEHASTGNAKIAGLGGRLIAESGAVHIGERDEATGELLFERIPTGLYGLKLTGADCHGSFDDVEIVANKNPSMICPVDFSPCTVVVRLSPELSRLHRLQLVALDLEGREVASGELRVEQGLARARYFLSEGILTLELRSAGQALAQLPILVPASGGCRIFEFDLSGPTHRR